MSSSPGLDRQLTSARATYTEEPSARFQVRTPLSSSLLPPVAQMNQPKRKTASDRDRLSVCTSPNGPKKITCRWRSSTLRVLCSQGISTILLIGSIETRPSRVYWSLVPPANVPASTHAGYAGPALRWCPGVRKDDSACPAMPSFASKRTRVTECARSSRSAVRALTFSEPLAQRCELSQPAMRGSSTCHDSTIVSSPPKRHSGIMVAIRRRCLTHAVAGPAAMPRDGSGRPPARISCP